MSYSAIFTEGVTINGVLRTAQNTLTENAHVGFDESIASDASDYEIAVAIDVSAVVAFYLLATSSNMTLETNQAVGPDNTINLIAGKPYMWYTGKYDSFQLTTDVTSVFITNTGSVAGTLQLECIQDPTPA
jgi:hypothetical protein